MTTDPPRKPRVLLVSLAGVTAHARELAARGLEVSLLHPSYVDLGDFGSTAATPRADLPYALHILPVFPTRPYPYSLWRGDLAGVLRRLQPDLVYLLSEPSELGAAQVVRLARRVCPQARLVALSFENAPRDWRGFPRCLRGWAERATLRRLDLVLGTSGGVRERLASLGFGPARVRTVYLPAAHACPEADSGRAHQNLGLGADAFLVGYVGRLVPEKGVDLLLRALAALPERYVLVVAGSGREEAALRRLADDLGVAARVRWLGHLPREQVADLQAASDVLVLPSRGIPQWREQFGMALVEAMACGTPVVGSTCGAIPEVVGDGGLVFPEGDAEALAECLRRLGEDEGLRVELAGRARRRAEAEFTWERYTERVLAAFSEVMGP